MVPVSLPSSVHVFVRDWLSANHVLLRSRDGHVLVDTGYGAHAALTLALVGRSAGPRRRAACEDRQHARAFGPRRRQRGARGALRLPIAVPAAEAPNFDAWDQRTLLYDYADQHVDRFGVDERIEAGSAHRWGDLEWQALAAPGHDMGALVFFNPEHGVLISGDALWRRGFGFVMPRAMDARAMPATRATLDLIASLGARVVIPGHGEPFDDVGDALAFAYGRLASLEADDVRIARYAVKAIFGFSLLHRRRMREDDVAAFVARVPFFRDVNDAVLRMDIAALAAMIVDELLRAQAVRREGDWIVTAAGEAG
jgi:glyoxylase-like metal-dependent hydrolase (beta-lactamase superfamily II)